MCIYVLLKIEYHEETKVQVGRHEALVSSDPSEISGLFHSRLFIGTIRPWFSSRFLLLGPSSRS